MKRLPWFLRDTIFLAIFVGVLLALAYGLGVLQFPGVAYYNRILIMIGINITLAVSLNIINGHAGQFSLGHAGFMAVGAYFSAFLTFFYFAPYVDKLGQGGTRVWIVRNALLLVSVLAGGALAAIAGFFVGQPSLR